jgi:hypothetical protein
MTLDAMNEQQPVRECQITGRRHGVPAAPEPSQLWWKLLLGAHETDHHVWEKFSRSDWLAVCSYMSLPVTNVLEATSNSAVVSPHRDNRGVAVRDL